MQITAGSTAPFTPISLISNVFLGEGVEVLDVSSSGKPVSVGYFTNGTSAVGLARGIIMTTGLAETTTPALGPYGADQAGIVFANNNVGGLMPTTDPDLSPIASGPLFDVTSYTIRFIPKADTLRFRYCFASEEYPEFACSDYNDLFGFFISGPGYPTPTNIARIPGTSLPVAINNLHPDNTTPDRPCPPKNIQYYLSNLNSNKQPTYDGLTRVLTAEAVVVPCDTYVIRLVIADVGDPAYDSGVFLEAKSFGTSSVRTTLTTPNLDGIIIEGCAAATLSFHLPAPDTADVFLDYKIFGTAVNGTDIATLTTPLVIPAGQQEVSLLIEALEDGLPEGEEWIAVDVRRDLCRRDTFYIYIRDNALALPQLPQDTPFCIGTGAITLDGTSPVPIPAPPFFENTTPLPIDPVNAPVTSTLQVTGVSPPIVQPGVIRSVCLDINHGWVDDIDVYLVAPGGQVLELMTDCGANGKNFFQTCFTPTATRNIANTTAADAPFTGEWQPEGPWSDLWGSPTNGTWRLVLKDDQKGFIGTLQRWSITFQSTYSINYQWTPSDGLSCPTCPITEVAPTETTTYHLTATDVYGCAVSDTIRLQAMPALPAPTLNCGAYTANTLTFEWSEVPGATGYIVNANGSGWMPANGTQAHTVDGLNPGALVALEVQAIGPTPCPAAISSATCSNCDQPVVNAIVTDATCADAANGHVLLVPDGQNPPYQFVLGGNANQTGAFDQLAPGIYTALVTDGIGCQRQLSVAVGAPPLMAVSLAAVPITCHEGDDGALRAEVIGGWPPYQYSWSDPLGQTQPQAVNLRAGTYTVTVSDRNGCTATATAALSAPEPLVLSVMPIAARCHGEASGVASISVSGGIGPYQYQWANGQTTSVATGLPAGFHGVTVADAAGCAKASFALITQPPLLTASTTATAPTCANGSDGSANVSAQGGSGSFTYTWNTTPSQYNATATQLAAGIYTVTVSDQNGCTTTASATLTAPPAIDIALAYEDARCHGQPTGSAAATTSGGTGPFTYAWNTTPPQNTPTLLQLPAGTYTVTVSDQNGCTATAAVTVGQPEPLTAAFDIQQARCFDEPSGAVSAAPIGGVPPYTFLWSSGESAPQITQKTANTYTLTLTDANGCTLEATASIGQPPALQIEAEQENIACYGQNTGALHIRPEGGTPPYAALWSGPGVSGNTNLALSALTTGQYTLILTDANGCTTTQTFALSQPTSPLSAAISPAADTLCAETETTTLTATGSGGTPPYTYAWSSGNTNEPTATLPPGTYTLTLTDANGCTAATTARIARQAPLTLALALEKVDCAQGGTAVVANAAYGNTSADLGRLQFQWSTAPPQSGARAVQLAPGQTYTVTATDPLGCTAVQHITIPAVLTVRASISSATPPRCYGDADGQLTASATGGQPPYSYAWSGGIATSDPIATALRAGTYTVTVSDRAGCTGTASATLTQPPALRVRLRMEPARCFGESNGTLSAQPEGGTPPYLLVWSNGQTGLQAEQLTAGLHALTLTDAKGCTLEVRGEVTQPSAPLSGTATPKNILCFGDHSGEIFLTATGGTPPYRYSLDGATWNGSARQVGLRAGIYQPFVADRNGCTAALPPLVLEERPPITVDLGPDITLNFGDEATLQASVSNAQPPLQYAWAAEDAPWLSCTACPAPLVSGLLFTRWFSLVVRDALGCTGLGRVRIAVEKRWSVHVPTAFSPNGDGNNDVLLVHGTPGARVLRFDVYDRWGEHVFSARDFPVNDPYIGWDGTFRGQSLTPGTFVWVLQVEWPDGSQETLQGQVLLVR